MCCNEPHGIQWLLHQDPGGLGSAVWLLAELTISNWQARLDNWGHLAVDWGTGVMVSLSHSRLASVGAIDLGRHSNSRGWGDPGPNVAPAAIPAPAVHISMVAVAWTMSPLLSSEVSLPSIQELCTHPFLWNKESFCFCL